MPRPDPSSGGFNTGRKRGCSPSSPSSSMLQNSRFKRAILVGKRGGSSTPVPTWRTHARSPSSAASFSGLSRYQPSNIIGGGVLRGSVSARKLANALWEMNKIPSPHAAVDAQEKRSKKDKKGRSRIMRSVLPVPLPQHLSDPSHSPISERSHQSRSSSRRRMMLGVLQRSRQIDDNSMASDCLNNSSRMQIEAQSECFVPRNSFRRTKYCLKDLRNSLIASKELLKTVFHTWRHEKTCIPLITALHHELDLSLLQVDQLIREHSLGYDEINYLKHMFMEEKSAWKTRAQEKTRAALNSMMEELDTEKKLRMRAERVNNKLGSELAKTKASLSKASKELDNEKRTREMIEQFCSDLVRGISEDKAEVEEMKHESDKIRAELENEREMLQLADVWREERVQMKLMEAKFQFEEKNAAVDQLRNELEAFLNSRKTDEPRNVAGDTTARSEVESETNLTHPSKCHPVIDVCMDIREGGEAQDQQESGDKDEDMDSTDSDLHSIELNMDSDNKSYSWHYTTDIANDEVKSGSSGSKTEVRGTNPEKASRRSSSLNGGASEGMKCQPHENSQYLAIELDQGQYSESRDLLWQSNQKVGKDAERNVFAQGLRDCMLAGYRNGVSRTLATSALQWNRLQCLRNMGDEVAEENSKVSEMVKAIKESGSKLSLGGDNRIQSSGHSESQLKMTPTIS